MYTTIDLIKFNEDLGTIFPKCITSLFEYLNTLGDIEYKPEDIISDYTEYETMYDALSSYPEFMVNNQQGMVDFEETLSKFSKRTVVIGDPKCSLDPFIMKDI